MSGERGEGSEGERNGDGEGIKKEGGRERRRGKVKYTVCCVKSIIIISPSFPCREQVMY